MPEEVDPSVTGGASGRRHFLAGVGALGAAASFPALLGAPGLARAAKWPERPVNLTIMYAAGGGTDVGLRAISAEMSKIAKWDVNVLNKPGSVGAIATSFVLDKPADGYWWLGAANYNKFVRVMGYTDSKPWEDWQYMQAANSLASWSVRADSPY